MEKNLHRDSRERVRHYTDFRGVDFGETPMSHGEVGRFAYLENLYRDYGKARGATIETIPGFRPVFTGKDPVFGIFFYNIVGEDHIVEHHMLIHEGERLWKCRTYDMMYDMVGEVHNTVELDLPSGQVACTYDFKGGLLNVTSDSGNFAIHTLFESLSLPRGAYTFSCLDVSFTEDQPFAFRVEVSDGQVFMVEIGASCSFTLQAEGSIHVDMVFRVPHEAAISKQVRLCLDSSTKGSELLYVGLARRKSYGFQMNGKFYLIEGTRFLEYDGDLTTRVQAMMPPDVLWQDKSRKRTLRQRNLLSKDCYNYFYVAERYADEMDYTFEISDRTAQVIEVSYLCQNGEWSQLVSEDGYTTENGYVTMVYTKDLDTREYVITSRSDMDFLQPYNLRIRIRSATDLTVTEKGTPAFTVHHGALEMNEVISRCTMACVFDGRVFLSGNSAYPDCVFYSAVGDPTFFGTFDYIQNGTGDGEIKGMTVSGDTLIVCMAGDGKDGAIYYHSAASAPDSIHDRTYPGMAAAYGMYSTGVCINFVEDPVFLAYDGLYGIERPNAFGERSVVHRSDYIDARLVLADLSRASVCMWNGYLCLLCPGGELYLADSRQVHDNAAGAAQYEWYYVSGVGVYHGQTYNKDENAEGLALGEAIGGEFYEGQVLAADEHTLYFGCRDGSVCAFWFDKREADGRFLPDKYTQNGRRYRSVLMTARDDGEIPHLRKRTIPHSTLVRTGNHTNLQAKVYVRTDCNGMVPLTNLASLGFDFRDLRFTGLSFSEVDSNLFAIEEETRGWMEKQYLFVMDEFCGTFSLADLCYSYRLCGRYRALE